MNLSIKKLLSCLFLSTLMSCASHEINKNYQQVAKPEDYKKFEVKNFNGEGYKPEVTMTGNEAFILDTEEFAKIVNTGYLFLGYGDFTSHRELDESDFANYASRNKTETNKILYQKKFLGSTTSSVGLTSPTSSTTYSSGSVYGSGGYANYTGSSTTYGTKTTYIPVTTNYFKYTAIFFAKSSICEHLEFGVDYKKATLDAQKALNDRNALQITRVCEGREGYNAGLFIGDIIVIDKSRKPASNTIYLIVFRGKQSFKIELKQDKIIKS